MTRTKRAQILMEPDEYQRLEVVARSKNVSVAELIRRAVRERYLTGADFKRKAVEDICEMNLTLPDWETLKKEISDAHVDGLP